MLRVLVVDDSALARKLIGDKLDVLDNVEVVGRASNGRIALTQIRSAHPDLLTLDLEMPDLDGVGLMKCLKNEKDSPEVLIVSSLGGTNHAMVQQALDLGAMDVVPKPKGPREDVARFEAQLVRTIRGLAQRGQVRPEAPLPKAFPGVSKTRGKAIVAIGISTGGPTALSQLIPKLPADLGVPVVIVQHMPDGFTKGLADTLNAQSPLQVMEAESGMGIEPGRVYIAPGGRQLKLEKRGTRVTIRLTDDPPENHCRPAADYMFRSVAQCYGARALGVIMTGMGDDGAKGLGILRKSGGYVLGQDQASCTVYGMPRAAREQGAVDQVVPLSSLAKQIASKVRGSA